MNRRRRLLGLLLASALTCSLTACVGLPDDGPVEEAQTSGSGTRSDAMAINPLGPQPDQSRSDVVKGFLDAMQATPIRTDVAREFLTEQSRDVWDPEATVIYDAASLPRPSPESGKLVDVTLTGANRVDERGSWQGAFPNGDLHFTVLEEDGEFRIAGPPDALIVPQGWYAQRFRQVSLYFFDPTSQVLVPDPVFVPRNTDLASTLVQRLVAGPAPDLVDYARNLLPVGTDPEIAVPVSDAGVATVDIQGDAAVPGLLDSGLLVAQLAWTLRQVPSVRSLRVSVDGEPVTPAGQPEVSVTTGEPFAPYVADANPLQFGLQDGRMVAGSAPSLAVVDGPFGEGAVGLRSITTDLSAARAAGVSEDGTVMYVGPVRGTTEPAQVTPVVTGATDLLVPAWDFSDRLWMVDRRPEGAVVSYLRDGVIEEIDIGGVTGQDVKSFLVSRDGARFVAVLRGDGEDAIVVSRLLQDAEGRVAGAQGAQQVDVEDGRGFPIRDIAWLSPTAIVVLNPLGDSELFQVRTASVDGAPGGADDLALTIDERVTGLIGSPDPDQNTYAVVETAGEDRLIDLLVASGGDLGIPEDVTSLGYVG